MNNLTSQITATTSLLGTGNAQAKSAFMVSIIVKDPKVEGLMQTLLKALGFECQFAPQGGLRLSIFESNPADLVLISTELLDRNGFELCLQLREKSTFSVLMVTTKRSTKEEFCSLKVGADVYPEEPIQLAVGDGAHRDAPASHLQI